MQLLLIGMPVSGKSTYLGALSHVLTAGTVETALRMKELADYEGHASALEERWLACEEVDRTGVTSRRDGQFRLQSAATGVEADLSIPDLSGEAFRQLAARGRCLTGVFTTMLEADGLVLFTNANRGIDDRLIFDAAQQYDALESAFEAEIAAAGVEDDLLSAPPEEDKPFNPEEMPEEVLIVEVLQMLNRRPAIARQRRVAVVVSAWDVVKGDEAPRDWLRRARPMLFQFLENNPRLWDVEVWGLSALGGGLPEAAERLRREAVPSMRIRVQGPAASEHDLTAPLAWLLEQPTGGS
ncbi:hypothetical protein [Brevundimonas sp. GCM10030266]|uniref:TRAFAC clade GTPase domain-containing protein n=1 Tax=Brevundimonas sp. GCM10030266 TaxID=3273386 RepID=UPI00360DBD18